MFAEDGDGTVTIEEFRLWWWRRNGDKESKQLEKQGKKLGDALMKKRKARIRAAAKMGMILKLPPRRPLPADFRAMAVAREPPPPPAIYNKEGRQSIIDPILPNYNYSFLVDPYDPYCPLDEEFKK